MTIITKIVKIELNEIINNDFEGFLDLLSRRCLGDEFLSDISYKVVGHEGDTLKIEVTGDDSMSKEIS